ncbi:MAG: sodium:calcium antiporter [Thermodesulfobacteria bacterium]|nr:sodium:calcium antiporter [Thermodesulfobacteriota bacterium]
MAIFFLLLSLGIILIASEIFTNAVESFGDKLGLSQAVVGSVLAAVGTALPETIIPLVAILSYKGKAGAHIGVGAILGAPFMLATVGLFLVGLAVVISYFVKKRNSLKVRIEEKTFTRDFSFFLLSYSLAIFLPIIFPNTRTLHILMAIFLLINYGIYLRFTFKAESSSLETEKDLYLSQMSQRIINFDTSSTARILILSLLQLAIALVLMIEGAHLFVENLEVLSIKLGIDPLIFALILAPIATELPEKCNSFLWALKGKDILAIGNMTGAMVFQSTFPVSIGIIFTSWEIHGLALLSALITIGLAVFYLGFLKVFKTLPTFVFFLSGLSYIFYIIAVIHTIL